MRIFPAGTEGTHPADVVITDVEVMVLVEVTVVVSATDGNTVVVTIHISYLFSKLSA